MADPTYRLVTRADDAALVENANEAIRDVVTEGHARNASVMAPAPALEDAADRLAGLDCDVGCHVTLTAEWEHPRWGSILPPGRVPTLVGADGTFPRTVEALERRADPEEATAEAAAQLERLREAGFAVDYLDTHMAVSRIEGFDGAFADLCEREGLVYADPIPGLSLGEGETPAGRLDAALSDLEPGTYALVAHPCYDRPDAREVRTADGEPGAVAADRDRQRRLFDDPAVREVMDDHGAVPVRYSEL